MLNLQSRFSIIEILLIIVVIVSVLLAIRLKKLHDMATSIDRKLYQDENSTENKESLKNQREEINKKTVPVFKYFFNIGIDLDRAKINYFGILPILLFATFVHQVYLFF